MIYTRLNNVIKGFALVAAMTFGLVLASSTNVNAQNYPYDRYNQYDRYNGRDQNGNQSVRFAYQRGYREGYQQGMQAARNGYSNNGYYNNGYNNSYGNNGYNNGYGYNSYSGGGSAWRQAYQNGFNRGYRDGYNRYRNRRSGFTITLPF